MIEIKKLDYHYPRQGFLFKNLELSLEAGSIVGLLGKNGAGKSTFLRILAGLLRPQKGEISVMGFHPKDRNPDYLQEIFFIPEEFEIKPVKIEQYIKAIAPFYPRFNHDKFDYVLKEFDLPTNKKLTRMSYGQKKKFLIAFTLATGCRLLVLDEPTNGLDIPSKAIFRKVMAGTLDEDQLVFISTHQVKDIENLIDRIIILDEGKILYNNDVYGVTQKYAFQTVPTTDHINVLYREQVVGGYKIISQKKNVETELDVELFFNAMISGINLN